MKLDKLYIGDFKNLKDFRIDFDETSLTTVLVGRNGSGKSNLLEALILIFRDLDLGKKPPFKYILDYECRDRQIHIDADPEREKKPMLISVQKEGQNITEEISWAKFRADASYRPSNVFGYYSGPSNRMERHFDEHQKRFYDALLKPKGEANPLRRLFYARLVHSQFVLLSFFSERNQDPSIRKFLEEELRIEGVESVLFVMWQPPWKSTDGDPRFWYAKGTVRDFLNRLYALALAPLRIFQQVPIDYRRNETREHLYLYLKEAGDIEKLAAAYPSQSDLFKALESTYISQMISEVRIKVRVRNAAGALTFRELSEGEQQLLMVLGLLRFTREDESLFLLDEPDTHLNPVWAVRYLDFLNRIALEDSSQARKTSHIIMTTHDPLTIAGLLKEQVQIIDRNEESGQIAAQTPKQDPRGMGVAALLTSDVFGLQSQLDLETLRDLDQQRKLITKATRTEEDEVELQTLNQKLAKLDLGQDFRDPTYNLFLKAWTKLEEKSRLASPSLSDAERQQQLDLAIALLEEIVVGE